MICLNNSCTIQETPETIAPAKLPDEVFAEYGIPVCDNSESLDCGLARAFNVMKDVYANSYAGENFNDELNALLKYGGPNDIYPIVFGNHIEGYRMEVAISKEITCNRTGLIRVLEMAGFVSPVNYRQTNIVQCPLGQDRIESFPPNEILALWQKAICKQLTDLLKRINSCKEKDDITGIRLANKKIGYLMSHFKMLLEKYSKCMT